MTDEPREPDRVRMLHPPPRASRWEANPHMAEFLLRLADLAAAGSLGQIVMCYRKEDGFGHYISPPIGAEETLAMVGLLDYVKELVKARIASS